MRMATHDVEFTCSLFKLQFYMGRPNMDRGESRVGGTRESCEYLPPSPCKLASITTAPTSCAIPSGSRGSALEAKVPDKSAVNARKFPHHSEARSAISLAARVWAPAELCRTTPIGTNSAGAKAASC